jgi:hypothetical protein
MPTLFTHSQWPRAGMTVPFGIVHRVTPSDAAMAYPLPETEATVWSAPLSL